MWREWRCGVRERGKSSLDKGDIIPQMNKEFGEIVRGFKRTVGLMERSEKAMLALASFLMLATGVLTNLPAVILGRLVDNLIGLKDIQFSQATPFIGLIVVIILLREILTVIRKYLVENIATQTEKKLVRFTAGYFALFKAWSG